jgi:O-antigen ligase
MNRELVSNILFTVGVLFFFTGIFFSRAMLSFSPGFMLAATFIRPDFLIHVRSFAFMKRALIPASLYLLLILSFFHSDNSQNWSTLLFRNLPMLIFPFCFSFFREMNSSWRKYILFFMFLCANIVAALTLIEFLSHYTYYTQLIRHSQNIQAVGGLFHIHFGVLMAICIFFSYDFIRHDKSLSTFERSWVYFTGIFLLIALHVFAFRTGILALYATAGIEIIILVVTQRKYVLGVSLLVMMLAFPMLAYHLVPSVKQRVGNTMYDISRYRNGQDINYYSISQRFAAWENASHILKRNWLIGVSPADLETEMMKQYEIKDFGLIPHNRVLIHNQYIFYAVCYGLLGLVVFLWFLVKPFVHGLKTRQYKLVYFISMISAAFMVDTLLDLQTGMNLVIFLYSFLYVADPS